MTYTTAEYPGRIMSLLACFDDGTIVVYDVCQHHSSEVREAETARHTDQRGRVLTVQGALMPQLKHWLFFQPDQRGLACSVCLQMDHDEHEPQDEITPISRVAAPLREDD